MGSQDKKSDAAWRAELSPEQYRVARQKGTEPAFSGTYYLCKDKGVYRCVCCGNDLFLSSAKYESGSGWPSFWEPSSPDSVRIQADYSHGMVRDEVLCGQCDAHLGHVFPDGPQPTGQRFCINSVVLDLEESDGSKD